MSPPGNFGHGRNAAQVTYPAPANDGLSVIAPTLGRMPEEVPGLPKVVCVFSRLPKRPSSQQELKAPGGAGSYR